ncbi:hypothetical protein J116_015965 [Streptomyces thermolilacinus SPC6]|uniref:Uncharacterized protein n=2 Tax=Streptomyces thermolilacinus TaxID=285540 RepID=A0A1D3DTV3_9ACTN|nr:hypothetical protein J116_015965 [Streptomyces thermolilacinus SPC6]
MKMRHVRAVAVFGVVLIALTGARGSGGGSCDGSSSSGSSSSSSGGSSTGGSDTDNNGSDNNGSSSSGGGSVPGGSGSNSAMRDIRIDTCKYDAAAQKLVARLTVTNDGSLDHTYDAAVQFKGAAGSGTPEVMAFLDDLAVPANGTKTTDVTAPYSGTQNGSEYTQCVVTKAKSTMS